MDIKQKKCKICWKEFTPYWIQNTCSIKCENEKKAQKDAKKSETKKLKNKVVKDVKKKKPKTVSKLTKKADELWSKLVKYEQWYKCAYCWKWPWEVQLHSHHLFTRSRRNTRLDTENWICLCASHHTLSSQFSAHQTWNEFFLWLEWVKWREWIENMSKKSQELCKYTVDMLEDKIDELKERLKKFDN